MRLSVVKMGPLDIRKREVATTSSGYAQRQRLALESRLEWGFRRPSSLAILPFSDAAATASATCAPSSLKLPTIFRSCQSAEEENGNWAGASSLLCLRLVRPAILRNALTS